MEPEHCGISSYCDLLDRPCQCQCGPCEMARDNEEAGEHERLMAKKEALDEEKWNAAWHGLTGE